MSIDVSDIVNDADLAFSFVLLRNSGSFVKGGYQEKPSPIGMWGPVQPATDEDVLMVPEADRVVGMFAFWCQQTIQHTSPTGTGDVIIWDGLKYKVLSVARWSHNGYYKAIGSRLSGE